MHEPAAENGYLEGIRLFNRGEFYICHEVLEDVWRPERGARRLYLQALIHVAVGFYHSGRDNPIGAERQLRKALKKLAGYLPVYEGVDTARLYREALVFWEAIRRDEKPAAFPAIVFSERTPSPAPDRRSVRQL